MVVMVSAHIAMANFHHEIMAVLGHLLRLLMAIMAPPRIMAIMGLRLVVLDHSLLISHMSNLKEKKISLKKSVTCFPTFFARGGDDFALKALYDRLLVRAHVYGLRLGNVI